MPGRILIIEDNPANLELMRYLLEAFGHQVISAMDGEEGATHATQSRPDLILCDLQLPVFDGYEVVRRLKASPITDRLPVIAVTAFAMVGDRDRVLQAGFDGYISKPIEPETFVPQVERYLRTALHSVRPRGEAMTGDVPGEQRQSKPTILVVDDTALNVQFALSLLERSGYRVVTATSIEEALARLQQERPALILSDVMLGQESGFDLIQQVRASEHLRSVPFIFLTSSFVSSSDRARGTALGATSYLTRPIEAADLLAEIERCLSNLSGKRDG